MSGSTSLSSASFTDAEKTDIRRFCGYPPYGGPNSTGFQSWRYYQVYGLLEFRMNNLSAAEYQVVRFQLANCYALENALYGASTNLDTAAAAVWTRNPKELAERRELFRYACRQLANRVGVPPGPDLGDGQMRVVV